MTKFKGHEKNVSCSLFLDKRAPTLRHPMLISVSNDKTIRLWNILTGSNFLTKIFKD